MTSMPGVLAFAVTLDLQSDDPETRPRLTRRAGPPAFSGHYGPRTRRGRIRWSQTPHATPAGCNGSKLTSGPGGCRAGCADNPSTTRCRPDTPTHSATTTRRHGSCTRSCAKTRTTAGRRTSGATRRADCATRHPGSATPPGNGDRQKYPAKINMKAALESLPSPSRPPTPHRAVGFDR